eukprot:Seg4447.7 transcript_id=Seg4447.7/GoldUCD/mRNA.D3Y31 product="hypothetical protein" protein_id=Seg4447.7/GoldUCD/D3Y31
MFRAMKQKHGIWCVNDVVDFMKVMSGEAALIYNTKHLLHKRKEESQIPDTAASDIPNEDMIKELFLDGRSIGNKVLEWLGMEALLKLKGHWDCPVLPKWENLRSRAEYGAIEQFSDEGGSMEEEETEDEDIPTTFKEETTLETNAEEQNYMALQLKNWRRKHQNWKAWMMICHVIYSRNRYSGIPQWMTQQRKEKKMINLKIMNSTSLMIQKSRKVPLVCTTYLKEIWMQKREYTEAFLTCVFRLFVL